MPEIDDTEPEEANGMKINSSTFASGENTTAYHKSSNATDSVPDITPLIKAALPQSDSVETREKPPKLLDIMEIMKSEMIMKGQPTMPSKNRTPVPPSTGSSGNGGMPKQSSMEVVAGSDVGFGISRSGTCEVSYKYEEGGDPSTAVSIKASTPIAADTKLHTVSQNSFPITELLTVKEGSNEKESLVNSLDSSAISQQRQNIQIPSINPSSNESKSTGVEKPPQVHQIMELSTPEALSGRSWSTVSDDGEEEGRDVEEAMPPLEEIIEEFKETDTGESTNVDNDCKSGFCMVKTPVVRSPPLEIVGKFEWKETTESETGCDDCGKDKPLVELNSNGRVVARTVPISYQSESSVPRLSNTGQVSIAIMYIIETSEEEQEDRNEETEEESGSSTDQDEQDNEPVSDQQTQSILPPVYLTADKTSNYSIIAGQKSDLSNSNSKENVPLRKPHNEGEVAANLGFGSSIIGSGSSSIAAPGMDPQRSKNGNGKCNSESFGSAYNRSGRKADVTVSYENEKVIKKPQNIERKLLSK
ncbi:hypothetical protein Ocin01_09953 [Orchesella cincta]|uniref:Uncharacterized protein n=1 Tax=Orchesella cincta TaxID=48709 RepID=A0A1D2MUH3_ORCCI|nr:hypothetical protein Ocin01_09953 [Orchesella cincta]